MIAVTESEDKLLMADWKPVSHVVLYAKISDAKQWFHVQQSKSSFPDPGKLLFLPVGLVPDREYINRIAVKVKDKKLILMMPDDLLGRIADVKLAVWLRNKNVQATYLNDAKVQFVFKAKTICLEAHKVSLNAFELASGFRSKIRTVKTRSP